MSYLNYQEFCQRTSVANGTQDGEDTQVGLTNCLAGARQRRMGLLHWLWNHKSCVRVLASSGGLQVHSQTMNTVGVAACSATAYPCVRLCT